MITDEMVEAACVTLFATGWKAQGKKFCDWDRKAMRRALEAAEAVRPKMVEVAEIKAGLWTDKCITPAGDGRWAELPIGTKLYAEQPK